MQGGDISNEVIPVPRVMVVWEGYMASLPAKQPGIRDRWLSRGASKWQRIVDQYTANDLVLDSMQGLAWTTNIGFDVITYLPAPCAPLITDWCDLHYVHFGPVIPTSPAALSRKLSHLPNVRVVCDPDPGHYLTFGGKGLHVTPHNPTFWR